MMADDTSETPTPTAANAKPAPRRAPRKTSASPAAKVPAKRKVAKVTDDAAKAASSKAAPAKAAPKPRSPKRAASVKASAPKKAATRRTRKAEPGVTDKVGGKWGAAAIAAGGVAAIGAAAALLTLRGSTPRAAPKVKGKGAHQPDGADSSKSFEAGIADENTIPE